MVESCPKNGDVPKAPLSNGQPSAVGRRKIALKDSCWFGSRSRWSPAICPVRIARNARAFSNKDGNNMKRLSRISNNGALLVL